MEEKIYFFDPKTKVTETYITGHRRFIFPISEIESVKVEKRIFSFYLWLGLCIAATVLFCVTFFAKIPCLSKFVWYVAAVAFVLLANWLRVTFHHYAQIYMKMKDGEEFILRSTTMARRMIMTDIVDAIDSSINDLKQRQENEIEGPDSQKVKLLHIRFSRYQMKMTPEMQEFFNRYEQPKEESAGK